MSAPALSSAVLDAKAAWRAAAYAIGAHLEACTACQPRIGSIVVRHACAEYTRLDAVERDRWDALESARRDNDV